MTPLPSVFYTIAKSVIVRKSPQPCPLTLPWSRGRKPNNKDGSTYRNLINHLHSSENCRFYVRPEPKRDRGMITSRESSDVGCSPFGAPCLQLHMFSRLCSFILHGARRLVYEVWSPKPKAVYPNRRPETKRPALAFVIQVNGNVSVQLLEAETKGTNSVLASGNHFANISSYVGSLGRIVFGFPVRTHV